MSEKFMRIIVFFDLPTLTKRDKQNAQIFRNALIKDGYYMIQKSVYGRLCGTIENVSVHENRLSKIIPVKGHIRSMVITEKQYSQIKILIGPKSKKDKKVIENQLSFF